MEFEWDPGKGPVIFMSIRFPNEAATVLGDYLGATAPDPDHSGGERRYITIGLSSRG
jgi:uncharacterized DUF497 family protein